VSVDKNTIIILAILGIAVIGGALFLVMQPPPAPPPKKDLLASILSAF